MKAKESRLLAFLSSSKQFVIPVYQRPHRWEEAQCRKLWDDVLRAGRASAAHAHFVGSVVYIQDGLYAVTDQPALLLIDGQQRLTTFLLLLEALARAQVGREVPGDFEERKLRQRYLRDPLENGDRSYKMLLSATDRTTLKAIIDDRPLPEDRSVRIAENFDLFQSLLETVDLAVVCAGLSKILVVDISLERGHDNPQLIFESLNSTGKELGQADLIRNYVLMGLEHGTQTRLYEDHWRPMELAFGQVGYAAQFDGFMRHYLTFRTGEIPNVKDVYDAFKAYAVGDDGERRDIALLVADIHRHATFFTRMALGTEVDKELAAAFHDIRELKADVATPFLLELYGDYDRGVLDRADFIAALRLIEAYIFRRIVCSVPTNSHNKTFSGFGRALRKERYLESIEAHFQSMPSYRRFPDDREFRQELVRRDLYNFRNRSYWLRRLENHERRERVAVEECTIEHILPQNENMSEAWRADLGPTWSWVRDTYLHTLGNLTLTAYNSSLSDRPWRDKRDGPNGLRFSPLRLNEGLGAVHDWNEEAIKARADRLSGLAVAVWRAPRSRTDDLAIRPTETDTAARTCADHQSFTGGPLKVVFDAIREQTLALNPAIVEHFGKLFVTYAAEDVFLSVIPHARKVLLVLNMPFPDLEDGRGLARDVSAVGHWGQGDVMVDLDPTTDQSYAVALIRQAFEWRMDSEGSA